MRGPWLAGIAFILGLAAAASLFTGGRLDGVPLVGGPPDAAVVRVANLGPDPAELHVSLGPPAGVAFAQWAQTLAGGEDDERRIALRGDFPIHVRLSATHTMPTGVTQRGESAILLQEGACPRGVEPVLSFAIETRRGIAFPQSGSCVRAGAMAVAMARASAPGDPLMLDPRKTPSARASPRPLSLWMRSFRSVIQ